MTVTELQAVQQAYARRGDEPAPVAWWDVPGAPRFSLAVEDDLDSRSTSSGEEELGQPPSRAYTFRYFVPVGPMPGVTVKSRWSKVVERWHHVTARLGRVEAPSWFTWARQGARHLLLPAGDDADVPGSVFNLTNSVVGSGVLGLPFAMSEAGLAPFLVILLASAALCHRTARMIVRVCDAERAQTYGDAALRVFGRQGAYPVQALIVAGNFGLLAAYMVITGDFAEAIGREFFGGAANRGAWVTAVAVLVMLPLSLKRNLAALRPTSFFSLAFVCVFALALAWRAGERGSAHPGVRVGPRPGGGVLRALPTAFFAYAAHAVVMPVYRSMEPALQTGAAFGRVSAWSFGAAAALYTAGAAAGYSLLGDTVDGNVLASRSFDGDRAMGAVTVLFAATIAFTYPLVMNSLRASLHWLLFGESDISRRKFFSETVGVWGASLLVGLLVTDVSLVFAVTGSVSSGFVSFVVPALLMLQSKAVSLAAGERLLCQFLVVFGVGACAAGLVASFTA